MLMSFEKKEITDQQTQSAVKVQKSINKNDVSYISSKQNFAVLIK